MSRGMAHVTRGAGGECHVKEPPMNCPTGYLLRHSERRSRQRHRGALWSDGVALQPCALGRAGQHSTSTAEAGGGGNAPPPFGGDGQPCQPLVSPANNVPQLGVPFQNSPPPPLSAFPTVGNRRRVQPSLPLS